MEIKSESKKEKSKRCKLFRQKTNKLDKQVANLININFYLVMPPAPSGSIIEHISQLFSEVALFSTVMCSQPIYRVFKPVHINSSFLGTSCVFIFVFVIVFILVLVFVFYITL